MNEPTMSPHFDRNLPTRQRRGKFWQFIFRLTTLVSVLFLLMLLYNIINQAFGYIAIETKIDPASLVPDERNLDELGQDELITILQQHLSAGRFTQLEREAPLATRSLDEVYELVYLEVLKPNVVKSWLFINSIFNAEQIRVEAATNYPQAQLVFKTWLTSDLIRAPQSTKPLEAGVRTALLGSLWTILATILVAFPLGVGAAIYLEEYAVDNRLNRFIQTNINNLAGVPSIIYGMLGLAIFVRALAPFTSGQLLGLGDGSAANGRTILSAGLTLALLVLPLIIINTQEAIKAVPDSLRHASYAVGATQWQTIWHHVLPSAIPGILTGTILAISRAIGETAPLVVVGAATYITSDPSGLFSKFTTLPIQIYQWSSRPQAEFQHLASAAILVLLIMLLSLNSIAIILRNHYRK
jgi:phosphate transport system permease protein